MRRAVPAVLLACALGAAATALPAGATGAPPLAVTDVARPLQVPPVLARLQVEQPAAGVRPGDPLRVVGRLEARDTATGAVRGALPSRFMLRVTTEDHTVFRTFGPFTTRPDGSFAVTLPGSATEGVSPTVWTDEAVDVAVSAFEVTPLGGGATVDGPVGAAGATVATPTAGLRLVNDFTSHVGWVKPGDVFPLRVSVRNLTGTARTGAVVTLQGVDGMTLVSATASGKRVPVVRNRLTWRAGTIGAGSASRPTGRSLVVLARADSLRQDPRIVWKNLSTTARLTWNGGKAAATSHGPKVIPPDGSYDTARYGDRPFPVVPVDFADKFHRPENTGTKLTRIINDPKYKGSTFSLFQEMSLGQLFPKGTVASAGIAARAVNADQQLRFSVPAPAGTCRGVSQVNPTDGSPLPTYTNRIRDGWYQLPGTTDYYGDDKYGSGVVASLAGAGALFDIDGACGPTAKLAYDAAVVSDPEVDFNDYDTDKDGVVDFFEVIFVGLGGNGVSQLGCALTDPEQVLDPDVCGLGEVPPAPSYDNVWPHSSSLEGTYTDPATGLKGYVSKDQLKDLQGRPLYWTSSTRTEMTTRKTAYRVFVRVGPYNVNPESSFSKASVISHEYGHSLGLPDFYSTGSRETYGDWNLMAADKSQSMDVFSRQDLGWVVPREIPKGTSVVKGWKDSKIDTHTIHWVGGDGKPYTLKGPGVHNADAWTVKLPAKRLVPTGALAGASPTHAWWSGSGNDFGCPASGGHNLDIALPMLKNVPAGTTVTASFKSRWDIEWDYDYGFVMTGKPDRTGRVSSFTSKPSQNGYTTPGVLNPQSSGCQQAYGNGLTGTSASAKAGTQMADRFTSTYDEPVFVSDSYDISDLAGTGGVLRFSYSTDPGYARSGWFIDDLVVKAGDKVVYSSTFEKDGGPHAPLVYSGGCKEDVAVSAPCTTGWSWVSSSTMSNADRGYYLEMRDRSGFDFDGKDQNDRDPIGFQPGLLLVYTDETRGYGNTGVDDAPAQSPLDVKPQPGNETPELDDAAFKEDDAFSDITGHTDNYKDPGTKSGNWEFKNNCLAFTVLRMTGNEVGPDSPTGRGGDLRGDVRFTRAKGCGAMNYGYRSVGGQGSSVQAKAGTPTAQTAITPDVARRGPAAPSATAMRPVSAERDPGATAWPALALGLVLLAGTGVALGAQRRRV